MKQVTLIALYGQKPADFFELVAECQEQIAARLPKKLTFKPYDLSQIHATIVGLERVIGSPALNLNFAKYRGRQEHMNFNAILSFLRTGGIFPFQVQLGGFQNRNYPFTSRGQTPYDRSFSVQGDKAVLMGWPICGEPSMNSGVRGFKLIQESRIYPTTLNELRRAIQNFGVLHAYHRELTDIDNDFYFRIGLFEASPLPKSYKQRVESIVGQFLRKRKPIIIDVTPSDVYIASYEDETLPLTSTKVWSVRNDKMTSDFIENLYE